MYKTSRRTSKTLNNNKNNENNIKIDICIRKNNKLILDQPLIDVKS